MKTKSFWFSKWITCLLPVMAGVILAVGCASTRHTEQTERLLREAGFKEVAASSEQLVKHLHTLPVDRLTVVRLKGKRYYVFPDPAHNQLYVGNLQQYQAYQQMLLDENAAGQSRVMADLGEDDGDDDVNWVAWSNSAGWTYGDN